MRIDVWARASRDVAIVHCAGDIIYQREAEHLANVITLLQRSRVILDVAGVRAVDAYGIGKLIETHDWMSARHQSLAIVNPSPRLQELFQLTRLTFRFTPLDQAANDEGPSMSPLAKALFAKCPKCSRTSVQLVETYKTALQASRHRSFECAHCAAEYFAPVQQISCGVTDRAPANQ